MTLRPARPADLHRLATIWHDGWHDAHAAILPEALRALRTPAHFLEWLDPLISRTILAELAGEPAGFVIVQGDELYQLYVEPRARGTGLAAALVAEAERRIAAGADVAWLACAIGNDRAARFYEKSGWERVGVVEYRAATAEGDFPLEVWRYEKRVR